MNKYNIEGNINFYEELYKSLDEDDSCDDENICLITNQKLTDKFVKLNCGHKFNYIPLYHDLINYKFKYNNMESHHNRLKFNEIRCPYCRNKQVGLLPFYPDLKIKMTHGINCIDEKLMSNNCKISNPLIKCCYEETNTLFDETKPESSTNKKVFECYNIGGYNSFCSSLYPNILESKFCIYHQKIIIKQHNDKVKLKLLEEKQQAKLEKQKQKELKKLEKENEKKTKKIEKENEKKTKKLENNKMSNKININKINVNEIIDNNQNIVLGPSNITVVESENISEQIKYCTEIVKSGKNKGTTCSFKVHKDDLCKRHYKSNNKEIVNDKIINEEIK